MIKKQAIEISFPVTDAEKKHAEQTLHFFDQTVKYLSTAKEYLNIMKVPFKDNPEMSKEDVFKARAALRRFRDKAIDNFNEFKIASFKCVNALQEFASDTQVISLMTSFISSIELLEKEVNNFVDLFKNLKDKEFSKNTVELIESIQSKCDEIQDIVDERIKIHIQTNVLASTWVDAIGKKMQMKIKEKVPLVLDLYNKQTKE